MAQAKLLLDTNIVIDYLNEREPYYQKARLLMIAGRVGEFDLWMSSSQITDLIYILSEGGAQSLIPLVLERLRGLRTFVNIHPASDSEIDRMLASSWKDPEDALLIRGGAEHKSGRAHHAQHIGFRERPHQSNGLRRVFRLDAPRARSLLRRSRGLRLRPVITRAQPEARSDRIAARR